MCLDTVTRAKGVCPSRDGYTINHTALLSIFSRCHEGQTCPVEADGESSCGRLRAVHEKPFLRVDQSVQQETPQRDPTGGMQRGTENCILSNS